MSYIQLTETVLTLHMHNSLALCSHCNSLETDWHYAHTAHTAGESLREAATGALLQLLQAEEATPELQSKAIEAVWQHCIIQKIACSCITVELLDFVTVIGLIT